MPGSDECFDSRSSSCCCADLSRQDEWGVYLSDAVDVDGVAEKARGCEKLCEA
jgi:hypothetical protein